MHNILKSALTLGLLTVTAPVWAHTGHGLTQDFAAGLTHPFNGVDHLGTMLAVGLWAGLLGGVSRWLLPLSFLGFMAVGAGLAAAGGQLPHAEIGAQAALVVMGLAILTSWWLKAFPAATVAGFFALFHGYLHGAEITPGSDGMAYGAGFMLATALLHGAGLLVAVTPAKLGGSMVAKTAGALCAGLGLYLLTA